MPGENCTEITTNRCNIPMTATLRRKLKSNVVKTNNEPCCNGMPNLGKCIDTPTNKCTEMLTYSRYTPTTTILTHKQNVLVKPNNKMCIYMPNSHKCNGMPTREYTEMPMAVDRYKHNSNIVPIDYPSRCSDQVGPSVTRDRQKPERLAQPSATETTGSVLLSE